MKPKVYKFHTSWWNVTFLDRASNRYRTIFADSWEDALGLVAHGYREGYFTR